MDQNDDTLVAQANQSNSIVNLMKNSNLNDSISSLNNKTSMNSSEISSQLSNSIDNDNHQKDNSIQCDSKKRNVNNLIENDKENLIDEDNKLNNNESNNQLSETIDKLGLNLDYLPQTTNLTELEQSTSSLNSLIASNKSETNSIQSSNSRANSPSRSSERSLPFPPKRITSETNLLISEIESARNHDEQIRFYKIERKNLMHLASLIINNLINNISPLTKTLECHDSIVLYDFFSIIEQVLKHGLKGRFLLLYLILDN